MSTTVVRTWFAAQQVAAHRRPTTSTDVFTDVPAGFALVLEALERVGATPTGSPFTIFHTPPTPGCAADVQMCVPVDVGGAPSSLGVSGVLGDRVVLFDLPAGTAATALHEGSYRSITASHAAVLSWAQQHGHQVAGPAREVYRNSPREVGEAELRTDVVLPIAAER